VRKKKLSENWMKKSHGTTRRVHEGHDVGVQIQAKHLWLEVGNKAMESQIRLFFH
jgi:hypothetical protein